MKVGDAVMFKPEGTYAEWFGGRLAVIESATYADDGKLYFRVKWIEPVLYFGKMTTISDFCSERFDTPNRGR